ncbi:hypothetical protein SLA2020_280960 [Shorea laevis]
MLPRSMQENDLLATCTFPYYTWTLPSLQCHGELVHDEAFRLVDSLLGPSILLVAPGSPTGGKSLIVDTESWRFH